MNFRPKSYNKMVECYTEHYFHFQSYFNATWWRNRARNLTYLALFLDMISRHLAQFRSREVNSYLFVNLYICNIYLSVQIRKIS
jgi:hypothetical protein